MTDPGQTRNEQAEDDTDPDAMAEPADREPHDPAACDVSHCHAKKHQGRAGDTCTLPAGWGTDHVGLGRCKLHGGNTPGQRRRALTQAAEEDAQSVLAHHGLAPVEDPVSELGRLASSALAMTEALAERVNALQDIRYDGTGPVGEQLRAEVQLYERFLDRSGRFLDVLAKHRREQEGGDPEQVLDRVVEGLLAIGDAAAQRRAAA